TPAFARHAASLALVLTVLAQPARATLVEARFDSARVPGPMGYSLLVPDDYDTANAVYPLVVLLHDRGGGTGFLSRYAPVFRELWRQGAMKPCILAAPDGRQSLFLDYQDGSEQWETL